jgi:hypothetical protein
VQHLQFSIKRIASVKGKNNDLGKRGIKKPPRLMFWVVGAGAVSRRPRMSYSLKNYTSAKIA